jgi:CRP-like cAMP-binding protein
LHLTLSRPDQEIAAEPNTSPRLVWWTWSLPSLSAKSALVLALFLVGTAVGGWLNRGPIDIEPLSASIQDFGDLLALILAAASAFVLARAVEAMLLASALERATGIFGLGRSGFNIESVAWTLGVPRRLAVAALVIPLAASLASLAWRTTAPALWDGATLGLWLFVLVTLLPLRPGPGTRLLTADAHDIDLSQGLRWNLAARFLPVGQRVVIEGRSALAASAAALGGWLALAGVMIRWWATPPPQGATPAAAVFALLVMAGSVGFAAWFVALVIGLGRMAWRLRGIAHLSPVNVPTAAMDAWKKDNALIAHVPRLAQAAWAWNLAPVGTLLTKYQALDRTFFWLASGEAYVLGRTPRGDVVHCATLRAGSGLGEIALLDNRPRSADVLVTQTALVASLTIEEFERATTADDRQAFADTVLASQALDRAMALHGLDAANKQRWLTVAELKHYGANDTVLHEGDPEKWMGLVVHGNLEVLRGSKRITELVAGDVFGEIAFLFDQPRQATLTARDPTLVCRWQADWLASAIDDAGVRAPLQALAQSRLPKRESL